jgi:uncharacterized protein DUF1877
VRQIATALEGFPIEERSVAYDPKAAEAAEIYVPQHGPEELREYFAMLLDFYRDAANYGKACCSGAIDGMVQTL